MLYSFGFLLISSFFVKNYVNALEFADWSNSKTVRFVWLWFKWDYCRWPNSKRLYIHSISFRGFFLYQTERQQKLNFFANCRWFMRENAIKNDRMRDERTDAKYLRSKIIFDLHTRFSHRASSSFAIQRCYDFTIDKSIRICLTTISLKNWSSEKSLGIPECLQSQ